MDKQVVILFSSGLDSYLAWRTLLNREDINLHRIYFTLNSVYTKPEEDFLLNKYSSKRWNDIRFSSMINIKYVEQFDAYVPNRNLMLVTAASTQFPYADEIYINGVKDDRVRDNNRELFEGYSEVLSKSIGHEVKVKSLFWDIEKGDVVKNFVMKGGQILDLISDTYSCFHYTYKERFYNIYNKSRKTYNFIGGRFISGCLRCKACFRKACALTEGNVYIPFLDLELAKECAKTIDKNIHPVRFRSVQNYLTFLKFYRKAENFKFLHNE